MINCRLTDPLKAGWVTVAERGTWTLWYRGPGRRGWHGYTLRNSDLTAPKRSYWLAHNGERQTHNHDAGILEQYDPDIGDWAVAAMKADSANY